MGTKSRTSIGIDHNDAAPVVPSPEEATGNLKSIPKGANLQECATTCGCTRAGNAYTKLYRHHRVGATTNTSTAYLPANFHPSKLDWLEVEDHS